MEYKNVFTHGLKNIQSLGTLTNWLRFFVLLTVLLAIAVGFAFDRLSALQKKYDNLDRRHNRLNKIYLEEKQR